MTAPNEIQRWTLARALSDGGISAEMVKWDGGCFVTHSDCLRAVTQGKIAVLEEMRPLLCYGCRFGEKTVEIMGSTYHLSGHLNSRESCSAVPVAQKIAALRKELEG